MKKVIATGKICIFLLCVFRISAYCKPDNNKIKTFSTNHFIEKAGLHFVKPCYAAGDTIYFKPDQLATSEDLVKAGGVSLKEMILQKFYGRGRSAGLIVVDGTEMPPGFDIDDLNASDIETVGAVYGANAAIYGTRAGNGVWVITTKQGDGN
jgi:hypothetical protein